MRVLHLGDTVGASLAVALGYFDGGHRGHRALLEKTVLEAKRFGCESAVFTFSHLPTKSTLGLFTEEERLAFFERAGIKNVILASFEELRTLSPEKFVTSVLMERCHARLALCGFNFRFGYRASGDSDLLLRLLPESFVLPPTLYEGLPISATRIKKALLAGEPAHAAQMLGRPYTVSGEITHGRALGRSLGFPTANFTPTTLLPRHGVYKTEVFLDGERYTGLTNVGVRPTVGGRSGARVETFIKDFSGDLYGRTLSVSFLSFLREEKQFSSIDELKAQIALDLQQL